VNTSKDGTATSQEQAVSGGDTGDMTVGLFRRMLVEEFRMHTHLFGKRRFVTFPLFAALMVSGGTWLLGLTGTAMDTVVAGVHLLVFFMGLQVGTAGLVGRDAMRDVLGDMTLLVFSGRTLPVSRRRLLTVFLAKDLVYYFVLFLTPIVAGFVPFTAVGEISVTRLGLLWVTVTGTFALGAGTSLTLAGIGSRTRLGVAVVLGVIVAALVAIPGELLAFTPYGVTLEWGPTRVAQGFVPLAVLLVVGPLAFEPSSDRSVRRIDFSRFEQLRAYGDGMSARALLEVTRSSGSVWKVVFSLGVMFGVAALLLDRIVAASSIDPSAGIAFGTLLGLGTYTTYNWVTQNDDPREYLRYPRGMDAVFRGKRRAFFTLSLPTGFGFLGVAAIWYPPVDLLLGVVIFPLVSVYVFGVTAYITGLSANELLFNTSLFALYGAAIAVVAVPLLVAALAYGTAPGESLAVALGVAVVAAAIGAGLSRRLGTRWHRKLRAEGD
jgi:hypothetical protein